MAGQDNLDTAVWDVDGTLASHRDTHQLTWPGVAEMILTQLCGV